MLVLSKINKITALRYFLPFLLEEILKLFYRYSLVFMYYGWIKIKGFSLSFAQIMKYT